MTTDGHSLTYLIIFGAAVRLDGSPSGSLRRRVEAAIVAASSVSNRRFLPTGGVGRFGPSEAEVMKHILMDSGVPESEIIIESEADDTLSSVIRCHRILRTKTEKLRINGGNQIIRPLAICTSDYHMLRCRLLFRLLGWPTVACIAKDDRTELGLLKWLGYYLRDWIAIPCDLVLLFWWIMFDRD